MDKRQDNQAAHQLKQQTAQRHAASGGIGCAVVEHRQQAGTEVGADDQAQRDRERYDARRRQRGRQQDGCQAGIADDGKHGANQRIQHDVAGQRGEDDLYAIRLSNRRHRLHDQLQRQQYQAKTDPHSPQLSGA